METATTTTKKAPKAAKKPSNKGSDAFAIVATGGKQYKVYVGDTLKIEKLQGELAVGDKITFDSVLLTDSSGDIKVGSPFISGAKVVATLNKIAKHKTIDVIKYKQKSRYFKKYGHRQPYFEVKIDSIA